jgi:hypothetical protein
MAAVAARASIVARTTMTFGVVVLAVTVTTTSPTCWAWPTGATVTVSSLALEMRTSCTTPATRMTSPHANAKTMSVRVFTAARCYGRPISYTAGVALKGLRRRLTASAAELHNERLRGHYTKDDAMPIASAPLRVPVRLMGEVKRMRTVPRSGVPSLEVVLCDGTGDAIAVFTGRRSMGGLEHGRGIVVEGVAHDEHGRLVVLNPAYTLLPKG